MNTSYPLVSILVPTFNEEVYVAACLESIFNQDYQNIEVIVFDDCSADKTVEIIESFRDSRLKLIKNPINEKHEKTWNDLLLLAQGKYVKLVCSDDLLAPNCISESVKALEEHPECILTFCAKSIIDPNGNIFYSPIPEEKLFRGKSSLEIMRESLLMGTNTVGEPNNVLFRATAIKDGVRYRFKNYWMVDPDFYIQLAPLGQFYYIPKRLASFRISMKSWSVLFSYRQARLFSSYIQDSYIQDLFKYSRIEKTQACFNAMKLQLLRQLYYVLVIVKSYLSKHNV